MDGYLAPYDCETMQYPFDKQAYTIFFIILILILIIFTQWAILPALCRVKGSWLVFGTGSSLSLLAANWTSIGGAKCLKPLPRWSTNMYLVATNLSHCISTHLTWHLLFHCLPFHWGHGGVIFWRVSFFTWSFSTRRICMCHSRLLFSMCHFLTCYSNTWVSYTSFFDFGHLLLFCACHFLTCAFLTRLVFTCPFSTCWSWPCAMYVMWRLIRGRWHTSRLNWTSGHRDSTKKVRCGEIAILNTSRKCQNYLPL